MSEFQPITQTNKQDNQSVGSQMPTFNPYILKWAGIPILWWNPAGGIESTDLNHLLLPGIFTIEDVMQLMICFENNFDLRIKTIKFV